MENPSASDDSFKAFLEKIQTQNQRGFLNQQEIAGEDNDKREKQLNLSNKLLGEISRNQIDAGDDTTHTQSQLNTLNETLLDIKNSITGIESVAAPVAQDLEPVAPVAAPAIEPVAAPAKISKLRPKRKQKSAEEEKDTRGFFEIIKEEVKAAPGRIRDNLIGYNPKKHDTAKPQITGINPESDNIRDSAEIAADYEKEDLEISKQMLGVMREQLTSLKIIQEALAPNVPGPNKSSGAKSPGSKESAEVSGGGGSGIGPLDLLDALPSKKTTDPGKPTTKTTDPGKPTTKTTDPGKPPAGKIPKLLKFGGRVLAGAGLALGAYEASEFLDETGYGDKMKDGAGQSAEKAFRSMVVPTIDPVKAGITKDQAIAALENGSPRDIEKLGGKDALMKIAAAKAAPVAPVRPPAAQSKETVTGAPGSKAVIAKAALPSDVEKITNTSTDPKEIEKALLSTYPANMQKDISVMNNVREEASIQAKVNSAKTVVGGTGSKAKAAPTKTPAVQSKETVSGDLVAKNPAAITPKAAVTPPTPVINLTDGNNGTMSLPDGSSIPVTAYPEGDMQPRMPYGSQKLDADLNGQQVTAWVYGGKAYVKNYKAPGATVDPIPEPVGVQPAETVSGALDDQGTGYKPKYDWKVGHSGNSNPVAPERPPSVPVAPVAASAPVRAGQEVTKTTTENTDMDREASRGSGNSNTIVSNNVNNNNTTKFVPMRPTARPEFTGSALDRYTNKVSVFY